MRKPKEVMRNLILLMASAFFLSCQTENGSSEIEESKGLKDYYADYFPMGVAVYPKAFDGPQAELIKKHFVSMTPENVMKMEPIHPEPDVYRWESADKVVDFARANDLKIHGHTLCWHRQVPDWIFEGSDSAQVSKEELLARLQSHIQTVVGKYKEDVSSWDVVNEVISDKKDEFYRPSRWFEITGEDYIREAFRYAKEADPDAVLFYNDYNVINADKRLKIYDMVKALMESGVPIDGVGIQGHWSVYEPSEEQLRETIETFLDLGLKVKITELDVSIYAKEHSKREKKETDVDDFTDELKQKQTEQYDMIFRVLRDYKDQLDGVTFWNISDRYSWLDNFPVEGRKNYPLLFDENLEPKEAYYKVIDF